MPHGEKFRHRLPTEAIQTECRNTHRGRGFSFVVNVSPGPLKLRSFKAG